MAWEWVGNWEYLLSIIQWNFETFWRICWIRNSLKLFFSWNVSSTQKIARGFSLPNNEDLRFINNSKLMIFLGFVAQWLSLEVYVLRKYFAWSQLLHKPRKTSLHKININPMCEFSLQLEASQKHKYGEKHLGEFSRGFTTLTIEMQWK